MMHPRSSIANASMPPTDPVEIFINKGNRSQVIFSKYTSRRTFLLGRLDELVDEAVDAFEALRKMRGASLDDIFEDHWQLCINNGMEMVFDTTAEEDNRYRARYGMILNAMHLFKDWGNMWALAGREPCMTWWTITVAGNEAVIGWVDDGKQPHSVACPHRRSPFPSLETGTPIPSIRQVFDYTIGAETS